MLRNIKRIAAVILIFINGCTDAQKNGTPLTAQDFHDSLQNRQQVVVLDVRTPGEFNKGHLAGAINIDWNAGNFEKQMILIPEDKPVYIYCLSGSRSASAAKKLARQGYKVYALEGGIIKWRAAGFPVTENRVSASPGLSVEEFRSMVTGDLPVLVDFYGDWCVPCRKMKPWLDDIGADNKEKLKFLRISFDDNKALCDALHIDELPILHYYKEGELTWENKGFISKKDLLKKLDL